MVFGEPEDQVHAGQDVPIFVALGDVLDGDDAVRDVAGGAVGFLVGMDQLDADVAGQRNVAELGSRSAIA